MMIRILALLFLIFVSTFGCEASGTDDPDASVESYDYEIPMDASNGRSDGGPTPDMMPDMMVDEGSVDSSVSDAMAQDSGVEFDADTRTDGSLTDMLISTADAAVVDGGENRPIERQIDEVLEALGVADIDHSFSAEEITNQSMLVENQLSFIDALALAIESFLEDGTDQESPIALLEFIAGPRCTEGSDTERVRCFMNQEGSVIRLVTADGPPAENRESVEENWIFFMTLPTLSDHLLWAIVDRQGDRAPYNYGFN